MKFIKWGIIGENMHRMQSVGKMLSAIPGSSVELIVDAERSDIIDVAERTDINAVFISPPMQVRSTYAIVAMNSDKNVLIDQPFASNYEECARINAIQEKTKLQCFVNAYHRHMPYFQKVKHLLRDDTIGSVLNVGMRYWMNHSSDDDFNNQASLKSTFIGHIDILQYLLGIIVEVKGLSSSNSFPIHRGVHGVVNAVFKFENDILCNASWSFDTPVFMQQALVSVVGEDGCVEFSLNADKPIRVVDKHGEHTVDVGLPMKEDTVAELSAVDQSIIRTYPLLKSVVESLQGFSVCSATSVAITPDMWVVDRLFNR